MPETTSFYFNWVGSPLRFVTKKPNTRLMPLQSVKLVKCLQIKGFRGSPYCSDILLSKKKPKIRRNYGFFMYTNGVLLLEYAIEILSPSAFGSE